MHNWEIGKEGFSAQENSAPTVLVKTGPDNNTIGLTKTDKLV
jgi:hypothetical protein